MIGRDQAIAKIKRTASATPDIMKAALGILNLDLEALSREVEDLTGHVISEVKTKQIFSVSEPPLPVLGIELLFEALTKPSEVKRLIPGAADVAVGTDDSRDWLEDAATEIVIEFLRTKKIPGNSQIGVRFGDSYSNGKRVDAVIIMIFPNKNED